MAKTDFYFRFLEKFLEEKKLSPEIVAKILTPGAETATCLECCKFYIQPETATCGHTLCHGCWIGRQTCPECALPLKRRALKLNAVIKRYTARVQKLKSLFEKLYNVKMEELDLDGPDQTLNKTVEKDLSKTVNAWLCDSQNHFSASVSTQFSIKAESPAVEVKTCKVQVHTGSKKTLSPKKVIHAPPPPQDDWDKIESIPDTEEFVKNKENGAANIEPFILSDDEYTTDHPRRSSRKREYKNEPKPSATSADKHSTSNMSIDTDKLSKVEQNCSNVKKMRKEYSKLHKKYKNKLNVSIEMCKKTKSVISKPAAPVETESQKVILIDDFTPNTKIDEKEESPVFDKINVDTNNTNGSEGKKNKSPENTSATERHSLGAAPTNQVDEHVSKIDHKANSSSILNHFKTVNNHENETNSNESSESSTSNTIIPFLKKSALRIDKPTNDLKNSSEHMERVKENTVQTVNYVNDNIETDSDDIHISIKIGSKLTNILFKKKKNDVEVKFNTDKETQTLQCVEKSTSCNASPSVAKNYDVQNIKINIGGEGIVSAVTQQTKCIAASADNTKFDSIKTVSTKKKLVEISPSLEKELSKIMECDSNNYDAQKNKTQNITQKKNEHVSKVSSTFKPNENQKAEDTELDELQLKDLNQILMPTLKDRKQTQTQRHADKRKRENYEVMSSNKKAKVSEIYEDSIDEVTCENKDESSINYDSVMGNVDKSSTVIQINEDKTLVDKDNITAAVAILKNSENTKDGPGVEQAGECDANHEESPKDSESLFALSNVDSQIITRPTEAFFVKLNSYLRVYSSTQRPSN